MTYSNAREQKPNAKGTLTRLRTPSQQLTGSFTKSAIYKIILKTCFSKQVAFSLSLKKKSAATMQKFHGNK